ncbi:MAG: ferrochelatase [Chloroflexi bacterium]|nr:ferrochelatase [Chloroflexota bacterium]
MDQTAVLLLAYGGPNSLDDIPAFLNNVRGGQLTSPQLLEEITRRYRLIGGRSPLLDITQRLASKLQNKIDAPVYVGMRHWHPDIADTVCEMARAGIHHAVVICLAPHYSSLSIGAYRNKVEEAVLSLRGAHAQRGRSRAESKDSAKPRTRPNSELGIASQTSLAITPFMVDFVESWHTQPRYLQALADNVRETLARFPSDIHPKIFFTAHSLPVTIRDHGDPYEAQLLETARLIAQQLGLADDRWMLAFQSASRSNVPWLEPQIEKLIPSLGERNLIIAPIGFVMEQVEVLYDVDIVVQEIARANNVRLERTPMLNDSDAMVNIMADLVRERNKEYVIRDT